MPRASLEAALRRDHRDEDAWTVYADLLAAAGDVRGELIHLEQRASASADVEDAVRWREQARQLFGRNRLNLLGPIAGAKMDLEWVRGFVVEAIIHARHAWITEHLLARDIGVLLFWLTYTKLERCEEIAEEIAGSRVDTIELRWPKRGIDISPLARLPGLRELILQDAPVTGLLALRGAVGLERLLVRSTWVDFGLFDEGFERLRWLEVEAGLMSDTRPFADLRGLANLGQLEVLKLPTEPVPDIGPLADLHALREVDLSFTRVGSLEPLFELPKLERVTVRGFGNMLAGLADDIAQLRARGVEVDDRATRAL